MTKALIVRHLLASDRFESPEIATQNSGYVAATGPPQPSRLVVAHDTAGTTSIPVGRYGASFDGRVGRRFLLGEPIEGVIGARLHVVFSAKPWSRRGWRNVVSLHRAEAPSFDAPGEAKQDPALLDSATLAVQLRHNRVAVYVGQNEVASFPYTADRVTEVIAEITGTGRLLIEFRDSTDREPERSDSASKLLETSAASVVIGGPASPPDDTPEYEHVGTPTMTLYFLEVATELRPTQPTVDGEPNRDLLAKWDDLEPECRQSVNAMWNEAIDHWRQRLLDAQKTRTLTPDERKWLDKRIRLIQGLYNDALFDPASGTDLDKALNQIREALRDVADLYGIDLGNSPQFSVPENCLEQVGQLPGDKDTKLQQRAQALITLSTKEPQ